MQNTSKLYQLHHRLKKKYEMYKNSFITQEEYIEQIKPIDQEIDNLELSTLQDTPALKESFLQLSQKQES